MAFGALIPFARLTSRERVQKTYETGDTLVLTRRRHFWVAGPSWTRQCVPPPPQRMPLSVSVSVAVCLSVCLSISLSLSLTLSLSLSLSLSPSLRVSVSLRLSLNVSVSIPFPPRLSFSPSLFPGSDSPLLGGLPRRFSLESLHQARSSLRRPISDSEPLAGPARAERGEYSQPPHQEITNR